MIFLLDLIAIAAITIAVIRIAVDAVNMCVSSIAPQKLPLVYAKFINEHYKTHIE